ncbi:hypothetical protein [Legionella genomosp. 1]|uniref:hypothetical protein n=1 Tax=Legionella genomosp. 1 TaxID=1093625 RepID=UPI001054F368|nr:hypothetical protein [Legionella genomosp. 1]
MPFTKNRQYLPNTALQNWRNLFYREDDSKPIELLIDGEKHSLHISRYQGDENNFVSQGGTKQVYRLNNGKVFSILNCSTGVGSDAAKVWNWVVDDEIIFSNYLAKIGLRTQDYQKVKLSIDGHDVYVLQMTAFDSLLKQGKQVRDAKNAQHFGSTMLFGNRENAENPAYLLQLMQPLLDDIACLLAHCVHISNLGDSLNLIIEDTPETPEHQRDQPGLISERKQVPHLFFYDLSKDFKQIDFDNDIHFDKECRPKVAEYYIRGAYFALLAAINNEERSLFGLGECSPFQFSNNSFETIKEQLLETVLQKTEQLIASRTTLPKITEIPCPHLPQLYEQPADSIFVAPQPERAEDQRLCRALNRYISEREAEVKRFQSNYNSFWAKLFSRMDATTKIETAKKVIACIENKPNTDKNFSPRELAAALQGRLGHLMADNEYALPTDFKQQRDAYLQTKSFWSFN